MPISSLTCVRTSFLELSVSRGLEVFVVTRKVKKRPSMRNYKMLSQPQRYERPKTKAKSLLEYFFFKKLVAHEIGHNLGMHHDHHVSHGGDGNSCDKQGFMSYGEHEQKWTSCSRKDFLAHYNKIGEGNWCMPGNMQWLSFFIVSSVTKIKFRGTICLW